MTHIDIVGVLVTKAVGTKYLMELDFNPISNTATEVGHITAPPNITASEPTLANRV